MWDYGQLLFGSPDGFMDGATVNSVGDTHTPVENNIGKVPTNPWRAIVSRLLFHESGAAGIAVRALGTPVRKYVPSIIGISLWKWKCWESMSCSLGTGRDGR